MKIYSRETVLDAAKRRIRWLFAEFSTVYVNCSGGKDSTVVLNLALDVAGELGRLPLDVRFIDQEAEWQATIDYMRLVRDDPRVRLHWLQIPIKLFNATSTSHPWLQCWEPGKESEWMRPHEPGAITENVYGTDRFADLFTAHLKYHHPNERAVVLAGVRCEESPARRLGLTAYETYKGETWGRLENKRAEHYAMYPIYDWSYTDVWKAIHEHAWPYCALYDYQYQKGLAIRHMRVSNLHHETAVKNLFYLQEVERETFDRLARRIGGVHAAAMLNEDFYAPRQLPSMFRDWREYRDHLLANLIADPAHKAYFERNFTAYEGRYEGKTLVDLWRTQVSMILVNDYHGTKMSTFVAAHMFESTGRGARDRRASGA